MKLDDLKTLHSAAPVAMPPQSISEEVLLEKYAKENEQNVEAVRSVSSKKHGVLRGACIHRTTKAAPPRRAASN